MNCQVKGGLVAGHRSQIDFRNLACPLVLVPRLFISTHQQRLCWLAHEPSRWEQVNSAT
jgi:hypothetical protein